MALPVVATDADAAVRNTPDTNPNSVRRPAIIRRRVRTAHGQTTTAHRQPFAPRLGTTPPGPPPDRSMTAHEATLQIVPAQQLGRWRQVPLALPMLPPPHPCTQLLFSMFQPIPTSLKIFVEFGRALCYPHTTLHSASARSLKTRFKAQGVSPKTYSNGAPVWLAAES